MNRDIEIKLPCLSIEQPIGTFFIGVLKANELCDITYADVRRMGENREVESYLGIQRKLSNKRADEIKEYTKTSDACFPTSIILAIPAECASYNKETKELTLKSTENVIPERIAKVLDGQHRIEGLRLLLEENGNTLFDENKINFEVNVSIFIDMDIAEQAIIFSTVNLAQTKVNKSLVYDLYEYAQAKSPQKTCHSIAVALDKYEKSPFYRRIKRLGNATEGRGNETLTQATFNSMIMMYISKNNIQAIQDRDLYLRGKKPKLATEEESKKFIFRNFMINDEDQKIADIILNYFSAVKERWPEAWGSTSTGSMLGRTNGYRAFMRFLQDCYLSLNKRVPLKEDFLSIFETIDLDDTQFTTENYVPGSSGERNLYKDLLEKSNLNN